jgi:hypothetical protein
MASFPFLQKTVEAMATAGMAIAGMAITGMRGMGGMGMMLQRVIAPVKAGMTQVVQTRQVT